MKLLGVKIKTNLTKDKDDSWADIVGREIGLLIFLALIYVAHAFGWTYVVETVSALVGHPLHPNRWIMGLLAFVPYLGRLLIPVVILTFVVSMILV